MRIDGRWLLCDDGVVRPVIEGDVLAGDGSWKKAELLVDSAADRTVFTAEILATLGLGLASPTGQLSGVGSLVPAVEIDTHLRMTREGGSKAVFRGRYAAFTQLGATDMSVLGRDVLNLFALIIDRPGDVVCLLGQRHSYVIRYA
jgi:hypothetical protein